MFLWWIQYLFCCCLMPPWMHPEWMTGHGQGCLRTCFDWRGYKKVGKSRGCLLLYPLLFVVVHCPLQMEILYSLISCNVSVVCCWFSELKTAQPKAGRTKSSGQPLKGWWVFSLQIQLESLLVVQVSRARGDITVILYNVIVVVGNVVAGLL